MAAARRLPVCRESGVASGDEVYRSGIWTKAFGGLATQDSRRGVAGYKSTAYGATVGLDNLVTDDVRVGGALSYSQSDVKGKGATKTDTSLQSYQVALYGSYEPGDYFVEGQLAYALNDVDTSRQIKIGSLKRTAKGDYKAHQYSADVGVGMPIDFANGFTLTPRAGLFYSYTQSDSYTETGAQSLNRKVSPEDTQILEASLGTSFAYDHVLNSGSIFSSEFRSGLL